MRAKFLFIIAWLCLYSNYTVALEADFERVSFDQLPHWESDDHSAALKVFLKSCGNKKGKQFIDASVWKPICEIAKTNPNARAFFEMFFQPVLIDGASGTKFTGYFEPTIQGSRVRTAKYQNPIYRRPPEVTPGKIWKTRAEIQDGALNGRGLEIAWLADPVDTFFLHIQGSGRIAFADGSTARVGFAGKNGHKYRSVGQEMVRQKILAKSQASASKIKSWVRKNPVRGKELLGHNKSYVFFREIKSLDDGEGPEGAMRVPLSKLRTVAVDPNFNPLGMPVYVEMTGKYPMQRLMIAQDVGAAIKGAQRADIFFGSGKEAGKAAGRTNAPGRLYTLLPLEIVRDLEAAK